MRDRRSASTSLSAKIIAYLTQRGHTQADIARILGVTPGFVSLVKSRERALTLDHLERITQALSVPLGAFLLAVDPPPPGTPDPTGLHAAIAEAMRKGDLAIEALMGGGAGARSTRRSA